MEASMYINKWFDMVLIIDTNKCKQKATGHWNTKHASLKKVYSFRTHDKL